MSENQTLDRLISRMSVEERLDLLKKIRANSTISMEPLYVPKDWGLQTVSFEAQFKRRPWFVRMVYRVMGLFTGRTAAKVFEDERMLLAGRLIETGAPGVFDYRQNRLQEGFLSSLTELKEAARFFYNVLDTGINKDRGAFYAVLGSLVMEDIHIRLQHECGPQTILASNPGMQQSDLRQTVMNTMEETFQLISETQRSTMYYHARSLGYLKEMSCFPFDRFILCFQNSPDGRTCRISPAVRELMQNIDRILFSLREPPSHSLLESLFVYELETGVGEPGFNTDLEMATLLERTGEALATIRDFNRRIPLTRIIRCVTRNMEYSPAQISGGEDWFQVYRNYWKRQLENALAEYFTEKKRRDIMESLEDFFDTHLEPLSHVAAEKNPNGFPLPESFALSFLNAYHAVLNSNVKRVLRIVIMEGEFFRREDRIGMNEAYNDIMYAAEHIRALDAKLSPSGEHGKRYAQAKQEQEALQVKRRKLQMIQNDASGEAWDIITRSRDGMKRIGAMLEAILNRDPVGEYGGLSNFEKLAGRKTAAFTRDVKKVVQSLKQALKVLNDIDTLDNPAKASQTGRG